PISIYREIIDVTFSARQSGGSDGLLDSDSLEVVFSPSAPAGLLPDDITLTGAEISTADNAVDYIGSAGGYYWSIDFADGSLTAKNNETVRIAIADWGPYHVTNSPLDVTVYADEQEGSDEGWTLVRLMEAKQIGGSRAGEYRFGNVISEWSDKTTEGILLRFNKAINLADADISVDGATKGTLTDYGDDDPKTWYVPISNFYDQSSVYVYFASEEKVDEYYLITDTRYRLATQWDVIAAYKDIRPQVTYTLEQVGGASGLADTTELKLTITSTESMRGSGFHEGMVSLLGVRDNGFTSSASEDGMTYIWTYKLWGDWDNGDIASVVIQSWTGNGTRYMADANAATAAIYKDNRTYVSILSAKGAGGYEKSLEAGFTGRSYQGFFDDTSVEFTLSKSGDLGLKADNITLQTPDGTSIATISDDDDALTYDAQKNIWRLKLDAVTGTKGINPFVLSIADWSHGEAAYHVSNMGSGDLSNDNRAPIQLIAAEQIGGVADQMDSTGILLTLDREYSGSDATSFDFLQKVDLRVTGPTAQESVGYHAQEVEGRPDQVLLKLNSLRYSGTKTFQVKLADLSSHRSDYKVIDTTLSVDLYRVASSAEDGRALDSVMPRGIHIGSMKKRLTLSGILVGTHLSAMKEIRVREVGDEDTQNWTIIELPYIRAELSNYTLDVSEVELFKTLGDYEVSFTSYDDFASEWRSISVYDNPVYSQDGYGILAITQNSDKSFTLSPFEGESDMKAELGNKTPLVVFRGGILKNGDNYQVQSGSVINNALTYFDSEGDDTLKVRKMADGTIEIYADGKENGGELRWKNIPITARNPLVYGSHNFDIVLDDTKTYKTQRTANTGETVEITTGANDFSARFVFGEITLATYKLYDGECSISGAFMLGLPDWLIGTAYARVDLHQLVLANSILPSMHATGSIGMRPGGMLGDSVSDMIGGGEFRVEINTLPESDPRYIGASGNLDLAGMLYCEGELVLAWSEIGGVTVLMPNDISFFARVKNGGVPLLPPTIVAYINGFGGGIEGIAETFFGNFKLIPPIKVKAYGAVVDATGELFSVDKAEFKIGVGSISAYARSATILKLLKLENVGYEYGITDSTIPSITGLPSIDTYFAFGGQMSIAATDPLIIEGGLQADVRLRGNYLTDALYEYTLDCEEAGGFVAPGKEVKKALYKAIEFNGRVWASARIDLGALGTLVGGTGELAISKTKISGTVTGELWPDIRKKVGFEYNFKKNDLDFDVMRMALDGVYDEELFENGQVTITNLIDAGSYQPLTDGFSSMRLVQASGERPVAQADQIATVYADQAYDQMEIIVTLSDDSQKTIRLEGEIGWFET
ncbi:MAG: hypothetical protein LBM60_05890, partial [Clostridium sp.]|nr:hypothetical protein [Clostridium sp.]